MRNFILVALTFHLLVITVVEITGDYTFGDIISFPRECARMKKAYKHFAVYVGTKNLFGQGEDKDIFHRIRKPTDGKYCVFGSLKKEPKHAKENYLDNKLTPSSQADIIKHIEVMKAEENCGEYKLLNNNCEHLATWPGTTAGYFLKLSFGKKLPEADKAMESISDDNVIKILEELYKDSEVEGQC
ncbi:unnamed protein product [Oreochromis niloticus]|nr:unnamed protein product [Mustela putorius furo]